MKKTRRLEAKTDYKAREVMLRSKKPRIVFRKTNRYIIGQYIKSNQAQDAIICLAISKELLKYGWQETAVGSLKAIPASYLTGFLLGKKIIDKEEKADAIFDIGLLRNVKKSKIFAFLKGVIDSGIKLNHKPQIFPDESRILGRHMQVSIDINKIKLNIEKKFA